MRFTQTIFALAAFTSSVLATDPTPGFDAISSPSTKDQNLVSGSDFTITWTASSYTSDSDTVSIVILAGNDPATLQPGETITSIKNSVGSYTWKVPSSTAVTYGFKIQLNSDPTIFQYSQPFHITGDSASSSSASPSSASPSSSSSVSSSASAISSAIASAVSSAVASPSPCSSTIVSIITVTASTALATPNIPLATAASNTTLVAPTTSAIANTSTTLLKSTIGATKTPATTVGASASTPASSSSSATSPIVIANAAASNLAQGGIALVGGLVLAFAL